MPPDMPEAVRQRRHPHPCDGSRPPTTAQAVPEATTNAVHVCTTSCYVHNVNEAAACRHVCVYKADHFHAIRILGRIVRHTKTFKRSDQEPHGSLKGG